MHISRCEHIWCETVTYRGCIVLPKGVSRLTRPVKPLPLSMAPQPIRVLPMDIYIYIYPSRVLQVWQGRRPDGAQPSTIAYTTPGSCKWEQLADRGRPDSIIWPWTGSAAPGIATVVTCSRGFLRRTSRGCPPRTRHRGTHALYRARTGEKQCLLGIFN